MAADHIVIAHFQFLDDILSAVKKLRENGVKFDVYAPFPNHELEEEVFYKQARSPVRRVTLTGGITGCLLAFLMTCWMSVDYPIRVSAKPLISIPAFVVIAFECTILIGALFNTLAMLHFTRIPNIFFQTAYRPQFSEGTFGVTIRTSKEQGDKLKQELEQLGANLVETQYVR